jgi:hypothetical protein
MSEPLQGLLLVVDDIDVAREELIGHGVDVSDVWHLDRDKGPVPGPDPERRSYFSRTSFADPDGNEWQLQEVTGAAPGTGCNRWVLRRHPGVSPGHARPRCRPAERKRCACLVR